MEWKSRIGINIKIMSKTQLLNQYLDDEDDVTELSVNVFDLASLVEETFEPMTWAVEGLVPEGCILFAGKPKLGKSWFVFQLALAVASGDSAFGHFPTERADVLYLALEDTCRRLQSRAKRL